ncbi:hypothetical protein [Peribacillus deserti]|uniref:Uncharacterized protein n=1 Tax=Peribacillus deserti TaxID=673318 RepID=A0A2N5M332_9BACI|nr:hypothetical protein [Peribacillus deserti]PLT28683.1 hypothetical protein CUU66_17470 [Peribacillus deserti]
MSFKQRVFADLEKGNIYTEQDIYNFCVSNGEAIVLSEETSEFNPSNQTIMHFVKDKTLAFLHSGDSNNFPAKRNVIYCVKRIDNRT